MMGKTFKAAGIAAFIGMGASPLFAHADSTAMSGYLEKDGYEAACLAIRDASTIAAQALEKDGQPETDEELEALRTGLFYAAQNTAAEIEGTDGAGDRDRAMAAALGLMAADRELLDTHLQMSDKMGGSPEAIGDALGKTCNDFQSDQYKRNLALQVLVVYERLFKA